MSSVTPSPVLLGRYREPDGALRELVALPGAHGSVLVVDRESHGGVDRRLVAHLGADEPAGNAAIAARLYLAADPADRRCRALAAADLAGAPPVATASRRRLDGGAALPRVVGAGCELRLERVPGALSIPSLRWTMCVRGTPGSRRALSLREAIAALESYEPLRELTRAALARHEHDPTVSTTLLRTELSRVLDSSIVLNRRLREAVVAKVSRGEASMSEIAIRCGRLKQCPRGNTTGETSWLARRVGLLPEGGQREPTRWVHSDVLALIARQGLGLAPREVELG